jgi:hypothetical protein
MFPRKEAHLAGDNSQLLDIIAQVSPDEASAARTIATVNRVRKSLADAEAQVAKTTAITGKLDEAVKRFQQQPAIDKLSKQFAEAVRSGKDLDKTIEDIAKRLTQLNASSDQISAVTRGLTAVSANEQAGPSFGQQVTQAGRALFNAPDIGGSTTVSRALIGGGAAIDALGLSLE